MKPPETKNQFISLRVEGRSYAYIGEALNIPKATCTSWERELERETAQLKAAQLQELYDNLPYDRTL
jgi:DNA-directed RNA polymerase specialized sigma24 family protein